jgi:hypothetical protein
MGAQPPPDPAEDDGMMLSDLILGEVAGAITAQYAPDEVAVSLADEGIPRAQLPLPNDAGDGDAHALLAGDQEAAGCCGSSSDAGSMTAADEAHLRARQWDSPPRPAGPGLDHR